MFLLGGGASSCSISMGSWRFFSESSVLMKEPERFLISRTPTDVSMTEVLLEGMMLQTLGKPKRSTRQGVEFCPMFSLAPLR